VGASSNYLRSIIQFIDRYFSRKRTVCETSRGAMTPIRSQSNDPQAARRFNRRFRVVESL